MKVLLLIDTGSLAKRVVASFSVPDEYEVPDAVIIEANRRLYTIKTTYPTESSDPTNDLNRLIGN